MAAVGDRYQTPKWVTDGLEPEVLPVMQKIYNDFNQSFCDFRFSERRQVSKMGREATKEEPVRTYRSARLSFTAHIWLRPALLAAVLFLSAGEARTELVDGPVTCDGLGIGACVPMEKDLFDISAPFIVSDIDTGGDPLFAILADEEGIILVFEDLVSGRDLEQVGFRLTNVESAQDLAVGTLPACTAQEQTNCVIFLNWRNVPISRPEVTNDGGVQTIQWPLFTGGDPEVGSIVIIRPSADLVNGPVTCDGLGIGACTPMEKNIFDISPPYIVFDSDVGGDPVFAIFAEEEEISLDFTEFASENTVEQLGFQLIGLESTPDLAVGTLPACTSLEQTYCVAFLNWNVNPTSRPSITNDGGIQTLQWLSFTGGDPKLGSIANIRVLPEPSAAALTTVALATLGLIRLASRRRRR
jgi:hypothetical protein